jgi:hypothetical protein
MPCECQKPGAIYSGVKGIVAGTPDKKGRRYIERCDVCERFHSDQAAGLEYARIRRGGCRYDEHQRVLWTPA